MTRQHWALIGFVGAVIGVAVIVHRASGRTELPVHAATRADPSTISRAGIPASLHGFAGSETGFRVAYAPSTDPAKQQIRELFARDRVFENVAHALNQVVHMPRTVDIQMVDCGGPNAFYDPTNHRIIVCYELISYFQATFSPHARGAELGAAVMGATVFAFFHELGHALIHELELASTGREEDGADQIATLILLEAGDDGVAMALAGAKWFALLAADNAHRTPFWDEHALDGQRFYNVVCLVYGEKPDARASLVGKALPADRARRCANEYRAINGAWEQLLKPHLREGGAPPDTAPLAETRTAAADAGASCSDVGGRAIELVKREAAAMIEEELAKLPLEERPTAERAVDDRLRSIGADVERRCASEAWPAAVRSCLAAATSTDAGNACLR